MGGGGRPGVLSTDRNRWRSPEEDPAEGPQKRGAHSKKKWGKPSGRGGMILTIFRDFKVRVGKVAQVDPSKKV